MIYAALCIMFWMRAYPLLGQVGGGGALEFSRFLGPKWHSPIRSMPFYRDQKTGCSVAQIVPRWLAVRQARVRISARHPRGGPLPSGKQWGQQEWCSTSRIYKILYVCSINVKKIKWVAVCHQTLKKKKKKLLNSRAQTPPTCPHNGYARIQNIMLGAV